MNSRTILGMRVDVTTYAEAVNLIAGWADQGSSRSVCCANTHMVMESRDDPEFRAAVNSADLVTADGMPLVWALGGTRVYGPDLTSAVLARAAEAAIPVGFYGAADSTIHRLEAVSRSTHPGLRIVYAFAPPFRTLSTEEDERITGEIRGSGARILFIGLGCPKQERWIAQHRGRIPAVMLGVGAAFDLLAGVKPRAPRLMQKAGCEWLFRLAVEPSRLWRRYLETVPRFAWHLLHERVRPGKVRA